MNNLLLIVGVGRSGTSLLQSMFASHEKICYLPETSFIRRYLASGRLAKLYALGGKELVQETLAGDEFVRRTEIDTVELLRGFDGESPDYAKEMFCSFAKSICSGSFDWVGDKDPRLVEFLPVLPKLASKVSVIHVIRDPRDVLLSKKKAAWSRKGHTWKHIFANRVQVKLGRDAGIRDVRGRYYEVIYEDLISQPERVLRDLCDAFGLSFDFGMLQFSESAEKLVSREEFSWKKETLGPLLTTNKEKWKKGLSDREIALTELCCRQAFLIGGYRCDSPIRRLSLSDRLWVWAGATAIILMDWPYRQYRRYTVRRACKQMA